MNIGDLLSSDLILHWGLKVIAALAILVIGNWLAKKIAAIFVKMMDRNNVDVTLTKFLKNIIYYALLIAVVIAAAGQLGINTTSFLTVVGAAGLAIGFWQDFEELRANWGQDHIWLPDMEPEKRDAMYSGWKKAVTRTFDWVE